MGVEVGWVLGMTPSFWLSQLLVMISSKFRNLEPFGQGAFKNRYIVFFKVNIGAFFSLQRSMGNSWTYIHRIHSGLSKHSVYKDIVSGSGALM